MININNIANIKKGRRLMHELADKKGLHHPKLIKLSQKLDKLIFEKLKNNLPQYIEVDINRDNYKL